MNSQISGGGMRRTPRLLIPQLPRVRQNGHKRKQNPHGARIIALTKQSRACKNRAGFNNAGTRNASCAQAADI